EAVLGAGVGLQAGERRDESLGCAAGIEAIAGLGLAEELVGAGAALGGALPQAGDRDVAPHLIVAVGVADHGVGIDLVLAVAAIKAGLEGVGPAHAVEAAAPLRAGGVPRGDAQPGGGRDQPVEAGGEAADIVGHGAERLVGAD